LTTQFSRATGTYLPQNPETSWKLRVKMTIFRDIDWGCSGGCEYCIQGWCWIAGYRYVNEQSARRFYFSNS